MAMRAVLGDTAWAVQAAHSAEEVVERGGQPWLAARFGLAAAQTIRDAGPEPEIDEWIRATASGPRAG
jgi:hypothetical protein